MRPIDSYFQILLLFRFTVYIIIKDAEQQGQ